MQKIRPEREKPASTHGVQSKRQIVLPEQNSNYWSDSGSFLVIGASGGIGGAVTRGLLAHGARVLGSCRHPDALAGITEHASACDATVAADVDRVVDEAKELGEGKIAGVVLCSGSILLKPAHRTTDEEWGDTIARNLTAAFHVTRAAARAMRGGGSVVLCSSAAAQTGMANHDAIAAAKAGIEGLTRSAAATYASRGLRFNAVAPGLVKTAMASAIVDNPAALEASRSMHALGRVGEPDDVAAAILWLLDPLSTWVSGQVVGIDGGLARLRAMPRR